ncbi:hypothetical protein [Arthrobacter roseus]|uniref:PH-like domain-containing protein n=1 Tax=Arthrobacter roseus TaxID=136274 RepID=UPI001962D09C|nr:hypothetical protein [Arthrobacter roseus]MBM7848636.1 hypothetical protein [Arthrobacter roseus]
MDWLMPVALSVGLIVLIFFMIWRGWRGRAARQSDVGPLPAVPADGGAQLCEVEGQYVVSTTSGDWLDRIAVHGLGAKSQAVAVVLTSGIHFVRTGAPDVFIPVNAIAAVHCSSGMAGKFVEKDGLVIVSWRLGEHLLDTGFRTRHAMERNTLRDAIESIFQDEGQL